ncbi:MAG: transposase [Dehalococcoidia bacterium]|nr:transposase [Dehalococcoidia bacterium]
MTTESHHRRSIRLPKYDYSLPGAYFITICTFQRLPLFGEIANGEMRLTPHGHAAQDCWRSLADHFSIVTLDAFVVMPNHVHGVLLLTSVGAQHAAPLPQQPSKPHVAPHSLGAFVRGFKSAVTREVNALRQFPGVPVWQRNYYEHIIRDDDELNRIRQYIIDNPSKWNEDENNPANFP